MDLVAKMRREPTTIRALELDPSATPLSERAGPRPLQNEAMTARGCLRCAGVELTGECSTTLAEALEGNTTLESLSLLGPKAILPAPLNFFSDLILVAQATRWVQRAQVWSARHFAALPCLRWPS